MEFLTGFLAAEWLGKAAWVWLSFLAVVVALLALDLGVLHRKAKEIGVRESLIMSAGYIAVALAYGAWVWWSFGPESGMAYMTGFAVEKTLALDNVFVISLIFASLAIPRKYQHRVLLWGILGVIILRGIMIGLGTSLVQNFDWVLFVFGAFLILTGVKMLMGGGKEPDPTGSPLLKFMRSRLRVTDELHGEKFFVRQPDPKRGGKVVRFATPLFLALIMVEAADVMFAVDSIPAIFAITTDPFIVYTSNIFAILGLRALYFALAAMVARFEYLHYALAGVLVFIGGKIFYNHYYGKMDPAISLGVTVGLLATGVLWSLWRTRQNVIMNPAENGDSIEVEPQVEQFGRGV